MADKQARDAAIKDAAERVRRGSPARAGQVSTREVVRQTSEAVRNGPLDARRAVEVAGKVRTFDTGATRDADDGKPDYDGYFSPLVVAARGRYMLKHSTQSNGEKRASDNWQLGMPIKQYLKSLWRHMVDVWSLVRGYPSRDGADLEDALCAVLFNAEGMLHEHLKARLAEDEEHRAEVRRRMRVDYYHPDTMAGDGQPMRGSQYFDLPAESVPASVVVTGGEVIEPEPERWPPRKLGDEPHGFTGPWGADVGPI